MICRSPGVQRTVLCALTCFLVVFSTRNTVAQPDGGHRSDMRSYGESHYPHWDELPDSSKAAFEADVRSMPSGSAIELYFDTIGPVAILDWLEANLSRCHAPAHKVGGLTYDRLHDLGQALSICQDRCTNACLHGVVREAFGDQDLEDIVAKADSICAVDEMANDERPGACSHALGHAYMVATSHSIEKSLKGCSAFESRFDHYRCATGVFMEFRDTQGPRHHNASADSTRHSTEYPCDANPRYAVACYRYLLPLTMPERRFDAEDVAAKCQGLTGQARLGCFHALGFHFAGLVFNEPSRLPEICPVASKEEQSLCIEGVVENLAYNDKAKAREACTYVSPEFTALCAAAVDSSYYRTDKETLPLYLPD